MSMVDIEGRGLPLNMRHVARRSLSNTVPRATNPAISGGAIVGVQQTGTFTYADDDGDAQGTSTYRWLRDGVAIGAATAITYTPVGADYGHTLTFEVTPVAATGQSPGAAATSAGSVVTFTSASVANQLGFYDFSDVSTLFSDTGRTTLAVANGAIKGVTDKSGTGHHLSDATGATRKDAIQNGLSVGRFAAASVNKLDSATPSTNQPVTLFAAMQANNTAAAKVIVGSQFVGTECAMFMSSTETLAAIANLNFAGTTAGLVTWQAVAAVMNAGSSAVYLNAVSDGTGSVANQAMAGIRIGANNNASSPFDGDIGEVLVYSGAMSAGDRATVFAYLKAKWATP